MNLIRWSWAETCSGVPAWPMVAFERRWRAARFESRAGSSGALRLPLGTQKWARTLGRPCGAAQRRRRLVDFLVVVFLVETFRRRRRLLLLEPFFCAAAALAGGLAAAAAAL